MIEVGHTDEYGGIVDALLVSADDERLIVVEEFAYCGDGRAVYLQHSTKPVEIGETFAWEYHQSADDPDGDIRMVSIAEPDSPITHDGPDPKRIEVKWTPKRNAIMTDLGVILVGVFAEGGPAIEEMCG